METEFYRDILNDSPSKVLVYERKSHNVIYANNAFSPTLRTLKQKHLQEARYLALYGNDAPVATVWIFRDAEQRPGF